MADTGYRWGADEDRSVPFRVSVTDLPGPLMPHAQEEVEMMFFYHTSGGVYQCAGTEYSVSSNDLIIVNPHEIHSCSNWGDPCIATCLIVNTKKLLLPSLSSLHFRNRVSYDPVVRRIFNDIRTTMFSDKSDTVKDCIFISLIYELFGRLVQSGNSYLPQKTKVKPEFYHVLAHISTHIGTKLRLQELADIAHLSTDRFSHLFKEITGMSPVEYIINERINKACELLTNTSLSTTKIASECGFCTSSYFTQKFAQYMKVTPTEYRLNRQKNEQYYYG